MRATPAATDAADAADASALVLRATTDATRSAAPEVEGWLLAAFAQTSALRLEAAALLAGATETDVQGLHAVLETLVLHSHAPPPRIAALRMRRGHLSGAAPAPEPAPEHRKRRLASTPSQAVAYGYAHEMWVWMPGMQRRVNAYNAAVFVLRGFDVSLARRYVDEPPASGLRQCVDAPPARRLVDVPLHAAIKHCPRRLVDVPLHAAATRRRPHDATAALDAALGCLRGAQANTQKIIDLLA